MGFPGGSAVKNPPANAGDMSLIPGLGRSPGEGNDSPLQHSCLGNPMHRGAWSAALHGVAKEVDTTERLMTTTYEILIYVLFSFTLPFTLWSSFI